MCCETCIKYEDCLENDKLRDKCCSRCIDYGDCTGYDSNNNYSVYKNPLRRNKDYDSFE